jgi:DNA-binding transcriptional LysR family regulator
VRASRTTRSLDSLGIEGGFEPTIGYALQDIDVARALVAAGLGIAVMGQHTVPPGDTSVVTRPVPGSQAPARTITAAWLRHRRMPAVDRMLPFLKDAAAAHLHPPVIA